jgi:hypothetical protein
MLYHVICLFNKIPDGTLRDIVLSQHDGVDRPYGITFNNDFTKLFIINEGGETVLVYSILICRIYI